MKNENLKFMSVKSFINILSSKAFLLWMIGGWIIYYVLSAIWMEEAFGTFAVGISKNPFVQIPFVIFLISGYCNLVRASAGIMKRGKSQFIAWVILPSGMLIFLTGFFLSLSLRQAGQRMTGEGDIVKPPWVSETYRIKEVTPGLKESLPDTGMDQGIFAHEPKLILLDGTSNSYEVGAFPPKEIDGTYYHILNFGIAPGIRLFQGSNLVYRGYKSVEILVPGRSDYFEVPPFPYRFLISMEPEKTFQTKDLFTSRFNLENPVYRVRVFKGEKVIAEGDSRQWIRFDDFTLHFFRHRFRVMLEAAKDPGMPFLRLGIMLITIGIPLSLIRLTAGLKSSGDQVKKINVI